MVDRSRRSPKTPDSARRSWRDKPSQGRSWGWRDPAGVAGREMSWGLKLALWLAGLLALLVVFVAVLLRPPRAVHLWAAALTRYQDPLPPNAFADEDLQRFRADFETSNIRCDLRADSPEDTPNSQVQLVDLKTRLREFLRQVEPGGPSRRWRFSGRGTVIIYVSAHGVVDAEGQPCLLVHSGTRSERTEWIAVAELLEMITAEDRLREATKLVMLDAGRIREDWPLGILQNGFADALVPVVERAREADRNLFVLNSTRAAQQGLWASEIGGSLFGFAVAAGLNGEADRSPADGVVSLRELNDYLEVRVNQLAGQYRARTQQPLLIPQDPPADVLLAYADGDELAEPAALDVVELRKRHAALLELWQQRDALAVARRQGDPILSWDPLGWAELRQKLSRLEQVLSAGRAYDFWSMRQAVVGLLGRLGAESVPVQLPVCSLPLAARLDAQWSVEAQRAEQRLQQWLAPEPAAAADSAQPVSLTAAGAAAWKWLLEAEPPPDRSRVERSLQFIQACQPAGAAVEQDALVPPEIHLLGQLGQHLDWTAAAADVPRALRTESRAAELAAGGDPRSTYAVRSWLAGPDQQRRLARDYLFVGSDTRLRQARELWSALVGPAGQAGQYGEVGDRQSELTEAWRLRDELWADLPDLARWLMIHQPAPETLATLLELIDQTHELAGDLDTVPQDLAVSARPEIRPRLDKLTALSQELKQRIGKRPLNLPRSAGTGQQYEDLLDLTELGPGHVLAVAELLGTSLVSGEARGRLRSLYLDELEEQSRWPVRGSANGAAQPPVTPQGEAKSDLQLHEEYLGAVFSPATVRHPALELLDRSRLPELPEISGAADAAAVLGAQAERGQRLHTLAAIGGQIRGRLVALTKVKDQLIETTRKEVKRSDIPVASARLALSAADRMLRAASGLLAHPLAGDDPCQLLRQLDMSHLLLWHAESSLEDFWGPKFARRSDERPTYYFSALADVYLGAAQRLDPVAQGYESAVRQRQTKYVDAAGQWGSPIVQDVYLGPEDRLVTPRVFMPRQPDLPTGLAAFFVQNDAGKTVTLLTPGVAIQAESGYRDFDAAAATEAPEEIGLEVTEALRGGADLQATCYYRGHRRQTPFAFLPFRGTTVVYQPVEYDPPTVYVSSAEKQVGLVMFVLDCSISMKILHLHEGRLINRLEISKSALRQALQELDESYHRVGLIAYGHSAGWSGDQVEVWRTPEARRNKVPPAEDVEQLLPLGRIAGRDENRAMDLRRDFRQLQDLIPYGETPLYLAMSEGIDRLAKYDRDNELVATRDLVVLTDGANSVFGKRVNARAWTKGTWTLDKVKEKLDMQAAVGRPVRLHIVAFTAEPAFKHKDYPTEDLQNDEVMWEREKPKWKPEDLKKIGDILNASQPEQLVTALRSALQRDKFYVQQPGAPPPPESDYRNLGERYPVEGFTTPASYVVTVVGRSSPVATEIRLEGGERIEMELDRLATPPRLVFQRYTTGQKTADVQQNVRGCYIAPHGSLPAPGGRILRVSVQNQNEQEFSPKPRGMWAEIRPLPDGKPVFYVQDLQFEANCPVPMLNFQLQDFSWTRAELKLWFTFDEPRYVDADQFQQPESGTYRWRNVTLVVESTRPQTVVVSERHDDNASLYPLRISLQRPADLTRRSYSDEARRVRHVFEWSAGSAPPSDIRPLVAPNPGSVDLKWIAPDPITFEW